MKPYRLWPVSGGDLLLLLTGKFVPLLSSASPLSVFSSYFLGLLLLLRRPPQGQEPPRAPHCRRQPKKAPMANQCHRLLSPRPSTRQCRPPYLRLPRQRRHRQAAPPHRQEPEEAKLQASRSKGGLHWPRSATSAVLPSSGPHPSSAPSAGLLAWRLHRSLALHKRCKLPVSVGTIKPRFLFQTARSEMMGTIRHDMQDLFIRRVKRIYFSMQYVLLCW